VHLAQAVKTWPRHGYDVDVLMHTLNTLLTERLGVDYLRMRVVRSDAADELQQQQGAALEGAFDSLRQRYSADMRQAVSARTLEYIRAVRPRGGAGGSVNLGLSAAESGVSAYSPRDVQLMEALSTLFLYRDLKAQALRLQVDCGTEEVFTLVEDHMLFTEVVPHIELLTLFHPLRAVELFLDHRTHIPVDAVVTQLLAAPVLLFHYLHHLYQRHPALTAPYARRLLQLYCEYAPRLLLPYLRSAHDYSLEEALRLAQQHRIYDAVVYLYLRTLA
jgi:hypothetical protein